MSKNIILLSDGTGNSNIKDRGTNVFKLYEALDVNSSDDDPKVRRQMAFYDDGVGTQEFKPLKILGGAFGWGLSRNVRQLYKDLVQSYEKDDKIYLFGFSRGAFTVRTLAGLIATMGILDNRKYLDNTQLELAVWQCYQQYRARRLAVLEKYFYKPHDYSLQFCDKPDIEFVGVWDTVDAVGLPVDEITDFWNYFLFRFKFTDHKLSHKVKKAYHALALDERRESFHPLLWQESSHVEQVWFAGVHSNVGGGYPQQGLSLVALEWMMGKAKAAGLRFIDTDVEFVKNRKYAYDKLYNSRSGLGAYYQYQPRDFTKICTDKKNKIFISKPKIHISVFERIAQGIFGYAPYNIPNTFEVVTNKGVHPKSKELSELISRSIVNMTPPNLIGQARLHIFLRRALHFILVIFSLLVIYWLGLDNSSEGGFNLFDVLKIMISPDSLLEKIVLLFKNHPVFIVIGAVIFSCTVYVRKKMQGIYSSYWSALRPKLEELLDEETKLTDK